MKSGMIANVYLGALPLIYTAFSTIYTRWRVRRDLLMYNIDAAVHTRLMPGFVEIEIPAFELSVLPRNNPAYWQSHKLGKPAHGTGSWKTLNWTEWPIQSKILRVYPGDRLRLPEARIEFAALAHYLCDLGYKTDPEGFWNLQKYGLKVIPGTSLFYEEAEDGRYIPVVVVAMPAVENPGSLLLRFQRRPFPISRGPQNLDPSWIGLNSYVRAESCISDRKSQKIHSTALTPDGWIDSKDTSTCTPMKYTDSFVIQSTAEYMHIDTKGITHKRVGNNKAVPVYGLCFWFTYSLLASAGRGGCPDFNCRPTGFRMRLSTLYFARECYLPINGPLWHEKWYALFLSNLSTQNMESIPSEWTEDSPQREDERLSKRFQFHMSDQHRKRSAFFRRGRIEALQLCHDKLVKKTASVITAFVPLETLEINPESWSSIANETSSGWISLLGLETPPSSQQICSAACSYEELGQKIGAILLELCSWFKGKNELPMLFREPSDGDMAIFLCALIILQSIADGAPYLATLIDVEECTRLLNPVYLS